MKTNIYKIIRAGFVYCGFAALVACSNEDYLGGHYVTDGAGTLMNVTAQIAAQTDPSLAWAEGDKIGIATTYGQYDATARNREYDCQADGKTFVQATGYPIYVKGNTDIVAYYPFDGNEGAEPTITLDTRNQATIKDYLFAKASGVTPTNGGNVNLMFDYALARLTLTVKAPVGETITGCRLSGFAQQATVDPYTLNMTLDAPEDLVIVPSGNTLSVKLIPQTVGADAAIPARLVLVGTFRSYSIDMSKLTLTGGTLVQATVDVTDGVGNIEFVANKPAWNDSGAGGYVTSDN